MLNANDSAYLLRAIRANNCILFLGAGFSTAATNLLGKPIPTGKQLASHLWGWVGLPGSYDDSPLSIVYEAALRAGRPLQELRTLLESELLVATPILDWYTVVSQVFWYRIYTTNADNLIETVYSGAPSAAKLLTLAAPRDDFRERAPFLETVQYVKLHGSLPGDPRELTFGTISFANRANAREDWWRNFVLDHVRHPTLFIGSQVDEPLFWQALQAREPRGSNPEERPKSFLVARDLSPARRTFLEQFNIWHIDAEARDFFTWLKAAYEFPARLDVLREIAPEAAAVLGGTDLTADNHLSLAAFLSVFPRVGTTRPDVSRQKVFFLGAPPAWEDIALGFDAPREVNQDLVRRIEAAYSNTPQLSVIAILGEGGSGKSTILKRAAVTLRESSRDVYMSDGGQRPQVHRVREAVRLLKRKIVLFVDNATLLGPALAELLDSLRVLSVPPVVVFAARYIPFEQQTRKVLTSLAFDEMEVPYLSDADIECLLDTLGRHAQLGHLAGLARDGQRYELKQRARKQILVAMREATEGRLFNDIIKSEFQEITDSEARLLFLCAALATSEMVDLSEERWLDCAEVPPADALRIMRRDLRGLVQSYGSEPRIAARHPIIAEFILDRAATHPDLRQAYSRILRSLAREIYPGASRKSRAWRLFVRLVNHQALYERFGADLDTARAVYDDASRVYGRDGHFWLQYANLEVDYGQTPLARPLLANAEGLLGDTQLVVNTRAHMMLREALSVESYEEAIALRDESEKILLDQMDRVASEDEYPFHIYLTHMLQWIRRWAPDTRAKRRDLERLVATAKKAMERMPMNVKLKGIHDAIMREYLGCALG